jgi:hypothetical protein
MVWEWGYLFQFRLGRCGSRVICFSSGWAGVGVGLFVSVQVGPNNRGLSSLTWDWDCLERGTKIDRERGQTWLREQSIGLQETLSHWGWSPEGCLAMVFQEQKAWARSELLQGERGLAGLEWFTQISLFWQLFSLPILSFFSVIYPHMSPLCLLNYVEEMSFDGGP